jgi:oligosaccharide:H+ symporter
MRLFVGNPLRENQVNRNGLEKHSAWLRLFLINVSFWVACGSCAPFISAYYKRIGLSFTQIGVLLAIGPIFAIFIQPLWAMLSDRTGKRKLLLILLALCTAGAYLLYYLGESFAVCLLAVLVVSLFSLALLPLCDALVIDRANAYGFPFARIRIGGTLGYAAMVFGAGMFLEKFDRAQFAVASVAYLLFAGAMILLPQGGAREEAAPARKKAVSARESIFDTSEILFVLVLALIESLGLGFCGSFMGSYAVELGFGSSLIGVLSCISALSEVPILLFAGKLVDRFGEIPLLIFSGVMMSLRLFLTGMGLVPAMISAQLLQSVTYMTSYICCTQYISKHVRAGKMSQGQSALAIVQSGLAAVVSNLFGGMLVDAVGTRQAFFAVAAGVLVVALLVGGAYFLRKGTHTSCTDFH